jgi:hypothetical protein
METPGCVFCFDASKKLECAREMGSQSLAKLPERCTPIAFKNSSVNDRHSEAGESSFTPVQQHGPSAEFPEIHAIPQRELGWNVGEIETGSLSASDRPIFADEKGTEAAGTSISQSLTAEGWQTGETCRSTSLNLWHMTAHR